MMALFERYPRLGERLPHAALASLPTPVQRLERLGEHVGHGGLYVKRDDVSARPYGGNKARKLEFLLGEAVRQGAREVLTFGCAGSNHATATAVYARQLGLRSISILLPQPNAHTVRRNLLLSFRNGAELHHYANGRLAALGTVWQLARHRLKTGRKPLVIPAGGSSALGAVGYVNAAFELADQVASGAAPEPDRVYVAAGTTGTAAGLMLGLRAAGLRTRVVPVRVTGARFANSTAIMRLFQDTLGLLRGVEPSFPAVELDESAIGLRHDFYGGQYALYSEASVEAVRLIDETEGLHLEGTYTGKALAAFLHDARSGALDGEVALFWNTYNSQDFSAAIEGVDYRELPRAFHRYFEEDVQPLDRRAG